MSRFMAIISTLHHTKNSSIAAKLGFTIDDDGPFEVENIKFLIVPDFVTSVRS